MDNYNKPAPLYPALPRWELKGVFFVMPNTTDGQIVLGSFYAIIINNEDY